MSITFKARLEYQKWVCLRFIAMKLGYYDGYYYVNSKKLLFKKLSLHKGIIMIMSKWTEVIININIFVIGLWFYIVTSVRCEVK